MTLADTREKAVGFRLRALRWRLRELGKLIRDERDEARRARLQRDERETLRLIGELGPQARAIPDRMARFCR